MGMRLVNVAGDKRGNLAELLPSSGRHLRSFVVKRT
jgi:hypothetical protein